MVPRLRTVLTALLPFALHALAREVDAAVGLLLHSTLDLPGLAATAVGLVQPARAIRQMATATGCGAVVWLLLAVWRARREKTELDLALTDEANTFAPLLLRPALTVLALLVLAARPSFPYGFTLPVALTQDWSIAQDLAAAAAFLAPRLPAIRLPSPRTSGVFFMAFLTYGLLTPERARHYDDHPGNEPKYLRMAISLGSALTLDVSEVVNLPDGAPPMESVAPRPLLVSAATAASGLIRETGRMLLAFVRGSEAVGAPAIQAKRLARQTVEGKEGGIFHVLAPGPSFLLAPTMRLDRALNLAHGTPGRMGVSVLIWNALAAALVALLFRLFLDVTGRPGMSAWLAAFFALTPPFVFFFFQFYPEMPGALLIGFALRRLLFGAPLRDRGLLSFGLLLATLPWLHQKFLPVWALLTLMVVIKAVDDLVRLRGLLVLLFPQALTLFLTALWNFSITGSARPDALFLAWGPRGVSSARIGEGVVGLLLDARYGLVPYAPVYLLAAGGLWLALRPGPATAGTGPVGSHRTNAAGRWLLGLPAVLVYYLTVAAADNWSGSVCNLGRYAMPAVPFLAVLAAVAIARVSSRRGALALVLTLMAWTGLVAAKLWNDPIAANDSDLLLAKAALADAHVYIPDLFFRSPLYLAPGHTARILAWVALAIVLGFWLHRAANGRSGASAGRVMVGLTVVALSTAFVLERWPSGGRAARFPNRIDLAPGTAVFVSGPAVVSRDGEVRASSGDVSVLVRSRRAVPALLITASGQGMLTPGRGPAVAVRASGTRFELPMDTVVELIGRRGAQQSLGRQQVDVAAAGPVVLRFDLTTVSPR